MPEKRNTAQVNLRAQPETIARLREEARNCGLTLGATVAELLDQADWERAQGSGLWVPLEPSTLALLDGVAVARGIAPEDLLGRLLRGSIRSQLEALAATLPLPDELP